MIYPDMKVVGDALNAAEDKLNEHRKTGEVYALDHVIVAIRELISGIEEANDMEEEREDIAFQLALDELDGKADPWLRSEWGHPVRDRRINESLAPDEVAMVAGFNKPIVPMVSPDMKPGDPISDAQAALMALVWAIDVGRDDLIEPVVRAWAEATDSKADEEEADHGED